MRSGVVVKFTIIGVSKISLLIKVGKKGDCSVNQK